MTDPAQPPRKPTYDGGIQAVLKQMEARRDPLTLARGEVLPALDVDLSPLKSVLIPAPDDDPLRALPLRSSNLRKHLEIRAELAGHTELTGLHGLLIAHLRKRKQPAHCAALFARLWEEEHAHLLDQLDARWLVSAITTFGDHGLTEVQRNVGQAMTVLFGTIKLYETERRHSGLPADRPFPLKGKDRGPLPMEMDPFHIPAGGLDVNMLGRLWQEADKDTVLKPLAHHLLDLLIHDPRTVFRRLRIMRKRKERRDATKAAERDTPEPAPAKVIVPAPDTVPRIPPVWGVVSTIDAPLDDIARFAAHYLTLGAARIDIYLDRPDPRVMTYFASEPRVHLIACDADYWFALDKERPDAHQLRQAFNATRAYRTSELDWLAHVDVDEFLICPIPVTRALRFVPRDCVQARMRPVEALADGTANPQHFKLTHREAGQKRRALDTIFPNFGNYLTGGFISHTSGKVFARTGLEGVRFGIHGLKMDGAGIKNEAAMPRMKLAHLHARSFDAFRARMDFRLERGSYRKPGEDDAMRLGDVLDFVMETEGEPGLRHFFEEVCQDSDTLRGRLAKHDMLFSHPLDLDAQVAEVFGSATPKAGAA